MSEQTSRRVLVACRDADGIPTLYPAVVAATDEQVTEEEHYRSAQKQTREHGYELPNGETICIDAQDAAHGGFENEFSGFFSPTDLA
jgi:hypothetical protein